MELQLGAADGSERGGERARQRTERGLAGAAAGDHAEVFARAVTELVGDLGGDVAAARERAEHVAEVRGLHRVGHACLFCLYAFARPAAAPAELVEPQRRRVAV